LGGSGTISRIAVAALALLAIIAPEIAFAQAGSAPAKDSDSQPAAPECGKADVDVTYQFLNRPPAEQQVVVNFRNISRSACVLQPGSGVGFGDFHHGHNIWTKSCDNCEPDGKAKVVAPITIVVGESAQFLVTWQTKPVDGNTPCQEGGILYANGWSIWAASLLGDVCSVVRVDSYLPVSTAEMKQTLADDAAAKDSPVKVELRSNTEILYTNDSFWLHIAVDDRNSELPLNESACPPLLLRARGAEGTTTLTDIWGVCRNTRDGEKDERWIRMDMPTMGWGPLAAPGEVSVQAFALVGSPHAERVNLIGSNTLNLRVLDTATIPRKWGPESKGLAISLFLDKQKFPVHEDISLRMAVEDFSADGRIASGELPCSAGITFEVRDANNQPIKSSGETTVCTGHGFVMTYPRGKIVPVAGFTLRGLGLLPDQPGNYTVVASWDAKSENSPDSGTSGAYRPGLNWTPLAPYAVVYSAPIAFEVVAQPQ